MANETQNYYVASKHNCIWYGNVSEMDENYSYPQDTEYFATEEEAKERWMELKVNQESDKEKDIYEIAEQEFLVVVSTTSEFSGYPKNVRQALIGLEDFKIATELAEKYDMDIVYLKRKNGQQLYTRTGDRAYEAIKISPDMFGDDYGEATLSDEATFIQCNIQIENFSDLNKLKTHIENMLELFEELEKLDEDEILITYRGDYYDTFKKEQMTFYHDSNTLTIALIEK
jgi:hypothetical protein